MKPSINEMLEKISVNLLTEVAPIQSSEYLTKSLNVMAFFILNAAKEYDQAAEIRVQENARMREIFLEASKVIEDDELRVRTEAAANSQDSSLRISALDAANDELSALLIDLHTYVENVSKPWASELLKLIWGYLKDSASKRREVCPGISLEMLSKK